MFKKNKYTETYFNLISKYRVEKRDNLHAGRFECHHILPRSLGGTDDKDNLALLPARVHFICHRLLPKMVEGQARHKMLLAAWTMARCGERFNITSHVYETYRLKAAAILKERNTGVKRGPQSIEHRRKLSEAAKKRYEDPEQRSLQSQRQKGKIFTPDARAKMSEAKKNNPPKHIPSMKGKKHSDDTKKRMREAWERRRNNSSMA